MSVKWSLLTILLVTCVVVQSRAQSNIFPSSGNVGIGTTMPERRLHIHGDDTGPGRSDFPYLHVTSINSGSGLYDGVTFGLFESQGIIRLRENWPLAFWTNDRERMRITGAGNVGIGTTDPTAKLSINGTTKTKEVIVTDQSSDWPDYVFDTGYKVQDLRELEIFLKAQKHLPGIPTKDEINRDGQNVGEIQVKLLKKIEELTLHTIRQQKLILQQQNENRQLQTRLEHIENKLSLPKKQQGTDYEGNN